MTNVLECFHFYCFRHFREVDFNTVLIIHLLKNYTHYKVSRPPRTKSPVPEQSHPFSLWPLLAGQAQHGHPRRHFLGPQWQRHVAPKTQMRVAFILHVCRVFPETPESPVTKALLQVQVGFIWFVWVFSFFFGVFFSSFFLNDLPCIWLFHLSLFWRFAFLPSVLLVVEYMLLHSH